MSGADAIWGPWQRHDGRGMPVRKGTVVEVQALPPHAATGSGITRRVGIAGADLVDSWHWTPANRTRGCQSGRSLPIDLYRVRLDGASVARVDGRTVAPQPDLPLNIDKLEEA